MSTEEVKHHDQEDITQRKSLVKKLSSATSWIQTRREGGREDGEEKEGEMWTRETRKEMN